MVGLECYLFGEFFARCERELITLGSSSGAWRMCCLATSDPVAAIERFARSYSEQEYSAKPTTAEISGLTEAMLLEMLGPRGATEIINSERIRTHMCRPLQRFRIILQQGGAKFFIGRKRAKQCHKPKVIILVL